MTANLYRFEGQKLDYFSPLVVVSFLVSMTRAKLLKMTDDSEKLKKKVWNKRQPKSHLIANEIGG